MGSGPTVWIAEEEHEDDRYMLTARFRGHLDDGRRMAAEFSNLSAREAIDWGRERAPVVLIRTGDSGYFSAGKHNPSPEEYPSWPPAGLRLQRRRVKGFEAMDNTEADPPSLWDVRLTWMVSAPVDPTALTSCIRADDRTEEVQTPAPGYDAPSAAFLVRTSTFAQAQAVAAELADTALDQLLATARDADGAYSCGAEVYPYRADVPVRGHGIVY